MFHNYQVPLNIPTVFENVDTQVWTSNTLVSNHFVYFFPAVWFYGLNCFLKKELTLNQSFLIEHSIVDTKDYLPSNISINNIFEKNRLLSFYSYYFYSLKLRLSFFVFNSSRLASIDNIYSNASWLERESAEMYGFFFYGKKDQRKLLLDYSRSESPMLKDCGTEGNNDFFFNFFEDQVCSVTSEIVEL